MDCTLKILTWASSSTSTKEWYSKLASVEVDGGTTSDWVKYETFVSMIAGAYDSDNAPPGTGSPQWTEAQSTPNGGLTAHTPVVALVFGESDVYSGGADIAAGKQRSGQSGKLRRLPMNNNGATTTP